VGNYFLQNYKIHKYFLQNLLRKMFYTKYFATNWVTISCKLFFQYKIYNYFLQFFFKIKLTENTNYFSSDEIKIDLKFLKSSICHTYLKLH